MLIRWAVPTQFNYELNKRSSLRKLAGGQFSRRKPKDKPRDANTSLISVNDFLPKLGVFNSSTSVRCTKSPMYWIASAFKQFADRTVNSKSSTGRRRIGSTSGFSSFSSGSLISRSSTKAYLFQKHAFVGITWGTVVAGCQKTTLREAVQSHRTLYNSQNSTKAYFFQKHVFLRIS